MVKVYTRIIFYQNTAKWCKRDARSDHFVLRFGSQEHLNKFAATRIYKFVLEAAIRESSLGVSSGELSFSKSYMFDKWDCMALI